MLKNKFVKPAMSIHISEAIRDMETNAKYQKAKLKHLAATYARLQEAYRRREAAKREGETVGLGTKSD